MSFKELSFYKTVVALPGVKKPHEGQVAAKECTTLDHTIHQTTKLQLTMPTSSPIIFEPYPRQNFPEFCQSNGIVIHIKESVALPGYIDRYCVSLRCQHTDSPIFVSGADTQTGAINVFKTTIYAPTVLKALSSLLARVNGKEFMVACKKNPKDDVFGYEKIASATGFYLIKQVSIQNHQVLIESETSDASI